MKLILQAIKALFRKVENCIEDVRKSIPEAAYLLTNPVYTVGNSSYFVDSELFDKLDSGNLPTIWVDRSDENYGNVLACCVNKVTDDSAPHFQLDGFHVWGGEPSPVITMVFATQDDWLEYKNDNEL